MNKLKSSLTCSYFSKVYTNTVQLPCKVTICHEHLIEKNAFKLNKVKCTKCKQEFEVNGKQYEQNKLLKPLLDDQLYLTNEETFINEKIKKTVKVFFKMYEELILSKNGLDLDCHNHFQEIRFQLDLHREKLKEIFT